MPVSTAAGQGSSVTGWASTLGQLTRTELTLFLRDRAGPGFAIGVPLILLIVFGNLSFYNERRDSLNGYTLLDVYVPILAIFVLATLAFNVLPTVLAGYRERGVLRRLQTTPAGPVRVMTAQLLANLATATVSVTILLLVARFAFGVAFPRQFVGYLVSVVLAAFALFAISLFVAAVSPNARVANTAGVTLFYALMFFAGLFIPIAAMPSLLAHISRATPLGAAVQALTDTSQGHWPQAVQLITLVGYAVALGLGAVRWFRWE